MNSSIIKKHLLAITMVTTLLGTAMVSAETINIDELTQKAEQGNMEAQLQLADYYYKGAPGVTKDPKRAVHWYTKLANDGFAQAQVTLGLIYIKGEGVPQDNAKGIEWFIQAAGQKITMAQYFLGIAYEEGHGVEVNLETAYMWYEIAAAMDHKDAIKAQKALAAKLSAAQIKNAEADATQWWLKHHH